VTWRDAPDTPVDPGAAGDPAAPGGAAPPGNVVEPGDAAPPNPVVAPNDEVQVRLSPSAVEALRTCPLQWFLERKVGAGTPSGAAAAVGVVVHAVAEALARGEVEADPRAIAPFVDEIWSGMPFAARYQSVHERERVDEMIAALLDWHRSTGREVHAAEASFALSLPTLGGTVAIAGKIDRVDRSESGELYLVDFKTGRSAATAAAAAEHPQLGVYQLAVREGALDVGTVDVAAVDAEHAVDGQPRVDAQPSVDAQPQRPTLGGAELVHLADRYASGMPKVRFQDPIGEGWTWVHDVVLDAARLAAGPHYPARRNGRCTTCTFRMMCPAQGPDGGPR
jgi:RecB family exonuclease